DDVGAIRHQQHARGERAGVDDAADEPFRRAHWHPDPHAVAGPGREDGEAPPPTDRRSDDAPDRYGRTLMLAQLEHGLQLLVLLEDRLGLDHPAKHRLALALELGILARRGPIIACAAVQALGGCRYFMQAPGYRGGDVERGAANTVELLRDDQRHGEQAPADEDAR